MTAIPQCMHCGSYTGTMEGKEFRCKSCGKLTDQPESVWKKDDPVTEHDPDCDGIVRYLKNTPATKRCGKCGWEVPANTPDVEQQDTVDPATRILQVNALRELLEAYDTGKPPFNMKSEAYDLQPLVEEVFDQMVYEAVEASKGAVQEETEKEQDEYHAEQKQALIEAVADMLAPNFEGLQADILALIEEHLTDDDA